MFILIAAKIIFERFHRVVPKIEVLKFRCLEKNFSDWLVWTIFFALDEISLKSHVADGACHLNFIFISRTSPSHEGTIGVSL